MVIRVVRLGSDRATGKRNAALREAACGVASRLASVKESTPRGIGKEAPRKLAPEKAREAKA